MMNGDRENEVAAVVVEFADLLGQDDIVRRCDDLAEPVQGGDGLFEVHRLKLAVGCSTEIS